MSYQFRQYTVEELANFGDAFETTARAFAKERPKASTAEWTEFNLDWFARTAAEGLTVDARITRGGTGPLSEGLARRTTLGEFMLDMAHTTSPSYEHRDYSTRAYWLRALEQPCQVRLALESEFGRHLNPDESFAMVLSDASKLAAVRADVKVMIFATQDGSEARDVAGALERLRRQSSDTSPWLWIDLPWDADMHHVWKPAHGILR
jgi:hypothetical protein